LGFINNANDNSIFENIILAYIFQFPLLKERGWGEVELLFLLFIFVLFINFITAHGDI
jgi:hypothetical protein